MLSEYERVAQRVFEAGKQGGLGSKEIRSWLEDCDEDSTPDDAVDCSVVVRWEVVDNMKFKVDAKAIRSAFEVFGEINAMTFKPNKRKAVVCFQQASSASCALHSPQRVASVLELFSQDAGVAALATVGVRLSVERLTRKGEKLVPSLVTERDYETVRDAEKRTRAQRQHLINDLIAQQP